MKIPLKRSYGLILGFLLAAGFLLLAYGSVLSQFFWDEDDFVYVSSAVGHSDPGYIFQRQFNVQEFPRPVTHLYFWLVSRLAGPAAWPYLLSNLLLYALSTVLLFKVVKKLTGNEYASIAVALLYLISPCATSNLFWVAAGATGYVSATLMLAALSLYLRSDFDVNPKVRIVAWAVALLAMGAKESALSLPLLMLMMDLTLARRRQGWFRRVLPFFIIAGLLALNVITVQLSYSEGANFSRYGPSWMILRNLMHYIIYPLIGALPPSVGEYTLLKMIIYPLLWAAPFVFGSRKVKRFAFFGLIWMVMTSLPYLPWIMGVQGFFPRICDIPSRYFNLPSMGAAMVMVSFIWMLWKKWGRRTAIPALILLTVTLTMFSVEWVRRETRRFVRNGIVTELLLNVMKDSYSPGRILYVGSFGFRPSRIASYNIMYFDGNLVQCQPFPQNVPEGTRLLCGPNTSPVLFYLENGNWTLQRRYDDCQAEADGMIRMN